MAKVESAGAAQRQLLSPKRRLWLAVWSLIRLLIVAPLWLFGLVALVLGIALSPWGTGLLFTQGEQRGYFTFEHQEGALLDRFTLQGFNLALGETRIHIDDVELAWADDCVLSGRLCLDTLRLAGVDIRLGSGTAPAEETPDDGDGMAEIRLPFPIELRDISLNDVNVQLADGTRITWEAFTTSAVAEQSVVRIAPTTLIQPTVYLPPSPGVLLTQDLQAPLMAESIDAAILVAHPPADETAHHEQLSGDLASRERLELPDITLPIDVQLDALTVTDFHLEGAFDYHVERLVLGLETQGNHIAITTLEVVTPDADASLTADATLADRYPLNARLTAVLWLPELFPELSGEEVVLELSGTLDELYADLSVSGVVNATLNGQVDALSPTLPFELHLQSERLQWPLTEPDDETVEPYVIEALDAQVTGDLEAYHASLALTAQGPQVPSTQVNLTGDGDLTSFRWAPLTLHIDESSLHSEGQTNWAAPLQIESQIHLEQFDPAHFVDQLDGNLNGDITVSVRQLGDVWEVSLPQLAIDGELQEYALTLEAALEANSNLEVDIQQLLFTQGENRLTAAGQVSQEAMTLDADIALHQLQTLHPDLAGTLTGNVQARGSFSQPTLIAQLTGRSLRFADNRVEQLSLDANVQGIDDPSLDIGLDLQQVNAGGQSLSSVALELNGQLSQHDLTVRAEGEPNSPLSRALLSLNGRFDQQRQLYQGRLTPLEIDSEAGDIRLEAPLDLSYNLESGQAGLTSFCLRRLQGGLVCSDEPITASTDQGQAVLSVREVPMEMLEPFLPEEWSFEGDTTADMVVAWRQGGAQWQANVQLLSELAITAVNDYGQPVQLPVINLDAQLDANQAQADANIALSLSEAGEFSLNLSVNDPLGRGALQGELHANNVSLEPYRPMMVGMDRLEGDLDGRVQITGTTSQPDLQGELALRGIRVHGPDIPVDVQGGELVVAFDGEQGDINGFLAAERGRLNITGDAFWPSGDDWRIGVDLNATQEPLLVVLPQFGRLEAAPDIRIRITPERLQIRGNVDLPWARLEVGDLPASAISPSSDEIIITEREDREAERLAQQRAANGEPSAADELAQTGMELDILITLTLGSDMLFSAYGLESGLGGTLEIRQDSGALQLFGEVNLVDGRFRAFGQDLLIRRGQLLFSGPPGLPVLDFEAIRNPEITEDEVIAGLRVTGNAEEPNISIFSEPSMDETRALSYLLRGRAPDESGGGIDSALTTALIGMSLGQTGGAVGSIGEAFGIHDLTLDTTGAGDESQVALSGQLTDDIRISYGVGIFSPIAELTLRYTLWRNLYVQAVSGANQAVDLIYTFTRSGNPAIYPPQ
ncbi:autotransporter assembly complex protein TamB [Vreelandella olivaria]|uniref:autotransporter assembly complex protein TamB n=1 Tax=Vreelandella olivaria TaxID=390919 RepID=UPI00201EFACD|nr:translocation/assembly module TamB domain-containing protein [Halomonas olivaria]